MDSAGRIRESIAIGLWANAVGETAAAASRAETVRDGVLVVRTKSSTWSHELTLYKPRILARLNQLLGAWVIQDIVFKAKGVPAKPAPEPDAPTLDELNAIVLEPAEKAELRRRLESLFHVENEHARLSLAHRTTLDMKLRHWQIKHGWKICIRCGVTHKTDYEICPICRLCR
jgi:predicted nucleic acid-binding Zn ribbon protein